jgi:hypothetical protein
LRAAITTAGKLRLLHIFRVPAIRRDAELIFNRVARGIAVSNVDLCTALMNEARLEKQIHPHNDLERIAKRKNGFAIVGTMITRGRKSNFPIMLIFICG